MASGQKQIKFNTRERVISPDQNRAQAFADATIAELWRAMLDTSFGTDDLDAAAVAAEHASLDTPVTAEILSGFMVAPQAGTTSVYVTNGIGLFINPDAGSDDSVFKYTENAGISALGALVISPNGGGSPRIDIVECRWSSVVSETDSRDIYDPTTDTFSAASVTKVTAGTLTYRVRQGTIGGGFASVGLASGWLPLAVVSVAAGATTVDGCTFWDVRPLVNDRDFGPFNLSRSMPKQSRGLGHVVLDGVGAMLSGLFEVHAFGRRLGGRIRPGVPGADVDKIDLLSANNQTVGQVPGINALYAVYFMTPFGLPRWARYTDGPSGRVPRSPRGIPVVSSVLPDRSGIPTAALNLPTITGLGGNTSTAVCVLVGTTDGSATTAGVSASGGMQYQQVSPQVSGTALAAGTATFTLTDNTDVPANAKALWCTFDVQDGNVPNGSVVEVYRPVVKIKSAAGYTVSYVEAGVHYEFINSSGGSVQAKWGFACRIPLDTEYPTNTPGSHTIELMWTPSMMSGTPPAATLRVNGWELGS